MHRASYKEQAWKLLSEESVDIFGCPAPHSGMISDAATQALVLTLYGRCSLLTAWLNE